MKKAFCVAALSFAALFAGCTQPQYYGPPPPPPPALDYRSIQQQGYHDGFEAARHDVEVNAPPRFDHHPRWRNPPVPPPGIPAYRQGFSDGYQRFLHP